MDQLTRRCLLTVSLLLAVAVSRAGDWLLTLGGRQQFTVAIAAHHGKHVILQCHRSV